MPDYLVLSEDGLSAGLSAAGVMRNRCAFTSRDMSADWPEAFTYAIVSGWNDEPGLTGVMEEVAEIFGWDAELIAFLRDAHEKFKLLSE